MEPRQTVDDIKGPFEVFQLQMFIMLSQYDQGVPFQIFVMLSQYDQGVPVSDVRYVKPI